MTFKALWNSIKVTWQSRPLALILPIVALAVFWWTHGHTWTAASFPSISEWGAGTLLLFTKFGHVMEVFVGPPAPETLPPPVVAPLLKKPPTDGPAGVVVLLLALGLAAGVNGCATVQPIVKDVADCAGPACADAATKLLPAVEIVLECDAAAGFSPVALPVCAEAGLSSLAVALGPDGWRIVGCITNAIEKDMAQPEGLRVRASAARKLAARKMSGR